MNMSGSEWMLKIFIKHVSLIIQTFIILNQIIYGYETQGS